MTTMPAITLSTRARDYLKKKLAEKICAGFRLSIKKTGCSGFSYAPSLVEQVNPNDVCVQVDEINIYIDKKWQHLLQRLHIDYVEDNKSGVKQKRLTFTNPSETSRCGCGESFHVDED